MVGAAGVNTGVCSGSQGGGGRRRLRPRLCWGVKAMGRSKTFPSIRGVPLKGDSAGGVLEPIFSHSSGHEL